MLKRFKAINIYVYRFYCNAASASVKQNIKAEVADVTSQSTDSKKICFSELKHESKVPQNPITSKFKEKVEKITVDPKTIQLLERLSLVDLDSKETLRTLEASIQFADKITDIDTNGIEPLYTVLEDRNLYLREDEVTDGNIKEDILSYATIVEEDYFVAPPGNIPLEQEEKKFD